MTTHFGTIHGNVTISTAGRDNVHAEGDIVYGNKTTTTSTTYHGNVVYGDKINTTSTTYHGFQQAADKTQFLVELEKLRAALCMVRNEVEANLTQDRKARHLLSEGVSGKINALNALEDQVTPLPPAQAATPQQTRSVSEYLTTTNKLLDQVKDFGGKAAEIGRDVVPVLLTLASLFGVAL